MEKNKIPTAEEVLDFILKQGNDIQKGGRNILGRNFAITRIQEYGQSYVKAALEVAAKMAKIDVYTNKEWGIPQWGIESPKITLINKDSILNAYPENLIK